MATSSLKPEINETPLIFFHKSMKGRARPAKRAVDDETLAAFGCMLQPHMITGHARLYHSIEHIMECRIYFCSIVASTCNTAVVRRRAPGTLAQLCTYRARTAAFISELPSMPYMYVEF